MIFSSLSNYDGAYFCLFVVPEMVLALDWCLVPCAGWWYRLKS